MSPKPWLCLFLLSFAGCPRHPQPVPYDNVPARAEVVFWEFQSWEPGGGSTRITFWSDGRSEVAVRDMAYLPPKIQTNVLPPEEVKKRFDQAFVCGIASIKEFKPWYVDGSGTVLGWQIDGVETKHVIPQFPHDAIGSPDQIRFERVRAAFHGIAAGV